MDLINSFMSLKWCGFSFIEYHYNKERHKHYLTIFFHIYVSVSVLLIPSVRFYGTKILRKLKF